MSTTQLIIRRLTHRWKLTLCILFCFTVSSTLVSAAPIFVDSIDQLRTNSAIDNANSSYLNFFVHGPNVQLSDIGEIDDLFQNHLSNHLPGTVRAWTRHVMLPMPHVSLPSASIPDEINPDNQMSLKSLSSHGSIYNIKNLENHITYVGGSYPVQAIDNNPAEIVLEAAIGERTAFIFDLKIGDTVLMSNDAKNVSQVTLKIVGVIEPKDKKSEFWHGSSNSMWGNMDVDPPETPSLSVFVTNHGMANVIAQEFPTSLVSTNWIIFLDKDQLKLWEADELLSRIEDTDTVLSQLIPGSALFTGIRSLLPKQNNRNFFAKIPMIMLLSFIVFTLLYFLAMTISYMVQQQEHHVALLRNRGISTFQILRLYALEGSIISIISMLIGPLFAYTIVAILGVTPMFYNLTGAKLLPISINWLPFALSSAIGLIQLGLFVILTTLGSKPSLVSLGLKLSRPSKNPFYQRYYIDIGMIFIGVIIFWELQNREGIVTGGLFNDTGINEVLLIGPLLLVSAISLLFMRIFPLTIQFITGESAAVQHILAFVAFLSQSLIFIRFTEFSLIQILCFAGIVGLYLATQKIYNKFYKLSFLMLQTFIVGVLIFFGPDSNSMINQLSTTALISLVVAQIAFMCFQKMASSLPVWINLAALRLSRNPYKSGWLILLIVLVTSLGVLSTTVGGTLEKSNEDRLRYKTGSDIRVSDIESWPSEDNFTMLSSLFEEIPGVETVSLAHRGDASVRSSFSRNRVRLLAMEPSKIPQLLRFRNDFSDIEIIQAIEQINSDRQDASIPIPSEAQTIGMWVNTKEHYDGIYLWAIVSDSDGVSTTISMGELGAPGWTNISAELPKNLSGPLNLESIQIYERAYGAAGTPGHFLIDDVYTKIAEGQDEVILEDFEDTTTWTTIKTSLLKSDKFEITTDNMHQGLKSAIFKFGKDTNNGIRGIYRSNFDGSIPALASSSFMAQTEAVRGNSLLLNLQGRTVPISIVHVIDYFPTLNPHDMGFVVMDIKTLFKYLDIVGTQFERLAPNEIFIGEMEGKGTSVSDAVTEIIGSGPDVYHFESLIANTMHDPLANMGWKLMVFISLSVIFITTSLGYIVYLLGYMVRYRSEMAFLKSFGLSRLQVLGLVGVENLVIIIIGISLGTWAGFQLSDVIVNSIAINEMGTRTVPPLITKTDWNILAVMYFGLFVFFITTSYILIRDTIHLNLSKITKMEAS